MIFIHKNKCLRLLYNINSLPFSSFDKLGLHFFFKGLTSLVIDRVNKNYKYKNMTRLFIELGSRDEAKLDNSNRFDGMRNSL